MFIVSGESESKDPRPDLELVKIPGLRFRLGFYPASRWVAPTGRKNGSQPDCTTAEVKSVIEWFIYSSRPVLEKIE